MFFNGRFLLHLVSFIFSIIVFSEAERKSYRAAVVEHVRFGNFFHSPQEIISKNLKTYRTAIRTAAKNDADIIVFPEWGLYPHNPRNRSWVKNFAEDIPDPKMQLSNPCTQFDLFKNRPILKELSCLAYENKIFLVVNMADAKKCSNRGSCNADNIETCRDEYVYCPEDETYLYNTNVIFDRQGTLIGRYYKKHLFFEFDMNTPPILGDTFFETEFGIFTTCICFDLVFKEAVEAVEKSGVVNVAYPTYWFDFAPFAHSATSFQQSWAISNKVNLLAANVHSPGTGTLGSGIYSAARGALIYTHNPDKTSKLLISNVPRFIDNSDYSAKDLNIKQFILNDGTSVEISSQDTIIKETQCAAYEPGVVNFTENYKCFQQDQNSFNFIKLKEKEGNITKCMNEFCCYLSYKSLSMNEEYFLGVFSGNLVALNSFVYGLESCFLTRCDSSNGEFCLNYVTKSNTVFQHVDLKGNFTTKYVYPYAVNSDILLTDKKQWIFDGQYKLIYHNLNQMNSILFLGLNGRHYDRDENLNQ